MHQYIRYLFCIILTLTLLVYPFIILAAFKHCDGCPRLSSLCIIMIVCFIFTSLFSVYIGFIDKIKLHKPTLLFYVFFFVTQSIIYSIALGFILSPIMRNPITMRNEIDYVLFATYPLVMLIATCITFSFESVFYFRHIEEYTSEVQEYTNN